MLKREAKKQNNKKVSVEIIKHFNATLVPSELTFIAHPNHTTRQSFLAHGSKLLGKSLCSQKSVKRRRRPQTLPPLNVDFDLFTLRSVGTI